MENREVLTMEKGFFTACSLSFEMTYAMRDLLEKMVGDAEVRYAPYSTVGKPLRPRPVPDHDYTVISANYLDRNSDLRWLVRQPGQAPQDGQLLTSLRVDGDVSFIPGGLLEAWWGCVQVAVTKAKIITDLGEVDPLPDRLTFNGKRFIDAQQNVVERVKSLDLRPDGKIFAVAG